MSVLSKYTGLGKAPKISYRTELSRFCEMRNFNDSNYYFLYPPNVYYTYHYLAVVFSDCFLFSLYCRGIYFAKYYGP